MTDLSQFSKKIKNRLKKHEAAIEEQQFSIDDEMQKLSHRRDQMQTFGKIFLKEHVYPRLEELCEHFDDAKLHSFDDTNDSQCQIEFKHSERFPAFTSLKFSITPGKDIQKLILHYDLEILPILMNYQRSDQKEFLTDEDSALLVTQWVEDKIEQFINDYLKLETHPFYQKDNQVTDPICGMQFPRFKAKEIIEALNEKIFFCSEVCKESYEKEKLHGK